jgi:isopentenyldiphosphate isomerase
MKEGESSNDAIIRGLREELGITTAVDMKYL